MKYYEINSNDDIDTLMKEFNWFHDSCLKELCYYSGGYVDKDGSMYPFNSIRCVKMIFQSQNANKRVIEIQFSNVKKLNLVPKGMDYDCVIYESSLKKVENEFYWSEWRDFDPKCPKDEECNWISAEKVSWRPLENAFGEKLIYGFVDDDKKVYQ